MSLHLHLEGDVSNRRDDGDDRLASGVFELNDVVPRLRSGKASRLCSGRAVAAYGILLRAGRYRKNQRKQDGEPEGAVCHEQC